MHKQHKKVRAIDKQTLLLLLEMGKSSYPNEYMVLLEEENGVINNTFMTNGSSSQDSANIFTDMIPLGMKFAGTAHSHPIPPGYGDSPAMREHMLHPSDQDLSTFCAIGNIHISSPIPLMKHPGAPTTAKEKRYTSR